MAWIAEFTCQSCDTFFKCDWDFSDKVQCPTCGQWWETDYETNYDDDILGPWLVKKLPNKPSQTLKNEG